MATNRGGPRGAIVALTLLAAGCGATDTPPSRQAETVLLAYYDALIRKDWTAAYARLHAECRAQYTLDQFSRLAPNQLRRFDFEPNQVRVRSCEEQGDAAIAHVVLVGRQRGHERSFRDAITLRREGDSWGVILPGRFGQLH